MIIYRDIPKRNQAGRHEALHTDRQLVIYIRFLERKLAAARRAAGLPERGPAHGFQMPNLDGYRKRDLAKHARRD